LRDSGHPVRFANGTEAAASLVVVRSDEDAGHPDDGFVSPYDAGIGVEWLFRFRLMREMLGDAREVMYDVDP